MRGIPQVFALKEPDVTAVISGKLQLCIAALFPSFARVVAPLNVHRRRNRLLEFRLSHFKLGEFREVTERLMSSPKLELPRHGHQYSSDTDACD